MGAVGLHLVVNGNYAIVVKTEEKQMSAIITSLSNLIKMLADLFRFPSLFPALFFVGLNQLFIVPHFRFLRLVNELTSRDLTDQVFVGGVLAILLGYTINAIEVPVTRLYEGYPWRYSWLGQFLTGWQLGCRKEQTEALSQKNSYSLPDDARVLPTALGNVIASFEAYPENRYRMNGIIFWPRLFPILVKHEFAPYIAEHRSTLDFLLNTSLLMGVFGAECILLRILFLPNINGILPLMSLIAAFVFYQAAISSACAWGEMFCTAFDLYRYQLAKALGLEPAKTFNDERCMWNNLSEFWKGSKSAKPHELAYQDNAWPIDLLEYKKSISQSKEDKK